MFISHNKSGERLDFSSDYRQAMSQCCATDGKTEQMQENRDAFRLELGRDGHCYMWPKCCFTLNILHSYDYPGSALKVTF